MSFFFFFSLYFSIWLWNWKSVNLVSWDFFHLAPMRIRKRPVLFSSSPVSDPHLTNRSPVVVQLSDAASTAPKLSHHAPSAPPSSVDRRQPSDQPSNGCDDPSGESGAHTQHNKQDPLVSKNTHKHKHKLFNLIFLIFLIYYFSFVFSKFHDVGFYKCTFVQSLASGCPLVSNSFFIFFEKKLFLAYPEKEHAWDKILCIFWCGWFCRTRLLQGMRVEKTRERRVIIPGKNQKQFFSFHEIS